MKKTLPFAITLILSLNLLSQAKHVEIGITQTGGNEASGYGIILGAAHQTDYYSSAILSKGKFRIFQDKNNVLKNIVK